MKIITKKEQDEIVKLLTANSIIFEVCFVERKMVLDQYTRFLENIRAVVGKVGDKKQIDRFENTVDKYIKKVILGEESNFDEEIYRRIQESEDEKEEICYD